MQLVYSDTKKPVSTGDIIMIDAERVVVEYIKEPHKPSSTGRVGLKGVETKWSFEYFPQVIGAEWIDRTDQ